jgi:hypothetical protein
MKFKITANLVSYLRRLQMQGVPPPGFYAGFDFNNPDALTQSQSLPGARSRRGRPRRS